MLGLMTRASDKTKKTRVVIALMYSFASGPLTCTYQLMMMMLMIMVLTKMIIMIIVLTI